jgi:hypothetical protein
VRELLQLGLFHTDLLHSATSTATALGPMIPQRILAQADEVRSILAITTNYHEFAAKGRS